MYKYRNPVACEASYNFHNSIPHLSFQDVAIAVTKFNIVISAYSCCSMLKFIVSLLCMCAMQILQLLQHNFIECVSTVTAILFSLILYM